MLNSSGNAIVYGQGENVIYGNQTGSGIDITGASSTNDSVIASFIGSKPAFVAVAQNKYGVYLENGATGNTIGPGSLGNAADVAINGVNVISNNDNGVRLGADVGANNIIAGNLIGTDATGTRPVPNSWGSWFAVRAWYDDRRPGRRHQRRDYDSRERHFRKPQC